MADFVPAFERTLLNEGGYVLSSHPADKGGLTFAGIARKANPGWSGWEAVDAGDTPTAEQVRAFYRVKYWDAVQGDKIHAQSVAFNLFDFAVNAGVSTAVKLAQIVVGTTPDGIIGPRTLEALNRTSSDAFVSSYALAKLARYEQIVSRDRTQQAFLLGWLRRTLRSAA